MSDEPTTRVSPRNPDNLVCTICGEEFYRKNEHECPGGLDDHDDRIRGLEERIVALEEESQAMKARLDHLEGKKDSC